MDYEIKYKEALERAKQLLETSVAFDRFTIERIFPELKESEDERIRKELLSFIQNWKDPENIYGDAKSRPMFTKNEHQCDTYIAWLEKQGEHKPQGKSALGVINEEKVDNAWSEEYIAGVFEKVGLAKIVREQSNDALTIALQDAMIELSKVTLQGKSALEAINEEKVDNINKVKTKFNKVKTKFQRIIAEQEFGLHSYSPRIRNILMPNGVGPDKIIADMTAEQFYKLLLVFSHNENIK